jgi:hypothetical protein
MLNICRRNIYGLVTLDSRLLTYIDRPEEFPSTRYDKLPDVPTTECAQRTLQKKKDVL